MLDNLPRGPKSMEFNTFTLALLRERDRSINFRLQFRAQINV
jgi:hypothetical protein